MKCPACQHTSSKVVDSRSSNDGNSIRRRRECLECGFRYSTYEQIELLNLYVIKKNGERESYQQEKLKRGINRALEKRPVNEKQIKKIITDIEQEIQSTGQTEISVNKIGEIVMKVLSEVDEVAYIRFASVYRSFKDIDSFKQELNKLLDK
jgi:transcriptional repressor NrdR